MFSSSINDWKKNISIQPCCIRFLKTERMKNFNNLCDFCAGEKNVKEEDIKIKKYKVFTLKHLMVVKA